MKHDLLSVPNLGIGVGLRTVHYEHILSKRPAIDWFEVLSDNYIYSKGRPLDFLDRIAQRYPVALHGVGLSIGSTDPLNREYVRQLKALSERCNAAWISDHIAWTGAKGVNGHDLYPVPYTEDCLKHLATRVRQVQDALQAPLVLENPSTYLRFKGDTLSEPEFIRALLEESGAALLLDVNNVFVNAHNHGFNPSEYLKQLPLNRVVQFHVAGHSVIRESLGANGPSTHLIDTHSAPVTDAVWRLLGEAFELGADAPVLLEWDADIPEFEVLHAEAEKARAVITAARQVAATRGVTEATEATAEKGHYPEELSQCA